VDCVRVAVGNLRSQGYSFADIADLNVRGTFCAKECNTCPTAGGSTPPLGGDKDCDSKNCEFNTPGQEFEKQTGCKDGEVSKPVDGAINSTSQGALAACIQAGAACKAKCASQCKPETAFDCGICSQNKETDCRAKLFKSQPNSDLDWETKVKKAKSDNDYNGSAGSGHGPH